MTTMSKCRWSPAGTRVPFWAAKAVGQGCRPPKSGFPLPGGSGVRGQRRAGIRPRASKISPWSCWGSPFGRKPNGDFRSHVSFLSANGRFWLSLWLFWRPGAKGLAACQFWDIRSRLGGETSSLFANPLAGGFDGIDNLTASRRQLNCVTTPIIRSGPPIPSGATNRIQRLLLTHINPRARS